LENGNSVEVEINDRGPYVGDRVIDLSRAAANALGFVESGLTLVRIEPLYQEGSTEEAG
jgi:rare lipoprotein A